MTAPMASAIGSVTSNSPVDWATAAKINGITTAPPSWLASWAVRARADTRTITPSPRNATAGATQNTTTSHSEVGTKMRWVTGHATQFDTSANYTKPTQLMTTAGTTATRTLA